jgi:hypothetical protein
MIALASTINRTKDKDIPDISWRACSVLPYILDSVVFGYMESGK